MSDTGAIAAAGSYRDFLKEVFIDPIRTAVVVDDEYPTLDNLVCLTDENANGETTKSQLSSEKHQNRATVKKIIDLCRRQSPTPWLVDVHDGTTPSRIGEQQAASHFDHTDLLILDYHLDKTGGSDRSIEILRQLAGNGHFNLVTVYTKQRVETLAIQDTVNEIALSLASPRTDIDMTPLVNSWVSAQLEEWEAQTEGIFDKLLSTIDGTAFLKVLLNESTTWANCKDLAELAPLASLMGAKPASLKVPIEKIFHFLISKKQASLKTTMAPNSYGVVTLGINGEVNWIRTDSLFVTVISKEHEPETIPLKLLSALEDWNPVPQRLIVSKMRAEMSARGGVAESSALRNRHLQAAWLDDLLVKYEPQRRSNVRQDVARHWENLGGVVSRGVVDFSDRLADFLTNGDTNDVTNQFRNRGLPDDKEQVFLHFNRYICSKEVQGYHLSTGHVLRLGNGANAEYWLCLSPACDLEPGQGSSSGWKKRLDDWMPLKAVRLYNNTAADARDSTRAHHIFLQIDDKVSVFGFAENGGVSDSIPTLRWEQFFAKNGGKFSSDTPIDLMRISSAESMLRFNPTTAEVVAQLRYEYAINLLQRLGAHLSRVGLDFRPFVGSGELA